MSCTGCDYCRTNIPIPKEMEKEISGMSNLLTEGANLMGINTSQEPEEHEPRFFKFKVGDRVISDNVAMGTGSGTIKWRRNGYPYPLFLGFWFPIYMVELDHPSKGGLVGGEIGEGCLVLEEPQKQQ